VGKEGYLHVAVFPYDEIIILFNWQITGLGPCYMQTPRSNDKHFQALSSWGQVGR